MIDSFKRQFQGIDIAKFICAILIIIMHTGLFSSMSLNVDNYFINTVCRIAVPFFFICNGFFIFRNIDIDDFSFKQIKKPLIKLIRLYIIWTLLYFPYFLIVQIHSGSFEFLTFLKDFALDLFWYGSYPIFWYILASIFGLLIISLLIKIKVKPILVFIISLPLYAFGLFISSYSGFIQSSDVQSFVGTANNIFGGTLNVWFNGLTFMSLGLCIWYYKPQISHIKSMIIMIMALVAFLVEHILLIYCGMGSSLTTSISLLFLIPSLFYFLLGINIDKDTTVVRQMSSLLYFSHTVFNLLVYQLIKHVGLLSTIWWSPVRFLLVIGMSLAFCYLIIRLRRIKHFDWLRYCF